jgi:hypothetical protein
VQNPVRLRTLAYFTDIYSRINYLNSFFQGSSTTVFNVQAQTESFIEKLRFLGKCLESNETEGLETLHDFLIENDLQLNDSVKTKELNTRECLAQRSENTFQRCHMILTGYVILSMTLQFRYHTHSILRGINRNTCIYLIQIEKQFQKSSTDQILAVVNK